MEFSQHTATLFIPYIKDRDTAYARQEIKCRFTPKDSVRLGRVEVQGSASGKIIVFEKDLDMTKYVEPDSFAGTGFTFKPETIVVLGTHADITSVDGLDTRYTVQSVGHNNYSFVMGHHFILEVV